MMPAAAKHFYYNVNMVVAERGLVIRGLMIYGMALFEEDAGDFVGDVMYGMVVFEEEDVAFVGWQLALGHGAFC